MLKKSLGWIYCLLMFVFLYTPIIVLMAMSFNESKYNTLPIVFTTKWYHELAQNSRLIEATLDSVYIASITGIICIVIGTLLVLGLNRSKTKIKNIVNSMVILPLTIPWIIIGLAILLLMSYMGLDRNFFFLLMGHVLISLPYAVLVIAARVQGMDKSIEEASYSLGANEVKTFFKITLPMIFPSILAGGFLAFMISFDNFVLSYFLIPTGNSTLPIEIYTSIRNGFTPEINAVSTIIMTISLVASIAILGLMGSSVKNFFRKGV